MTPITFSRNECAAYVAAIVRSFDRQHTTYLGRTALQKLVYFSKSLGVPIPCDFHIYTYGPYSDTITFTVESLLADDVVVDTSPGKKYSDYRLGEQAEEFFRDADETVRPYEVKIDAVVRALGAFKPEDLELIATLHFLCQRQRTITGEEPAREEIIKEFLKIKGEKFSREQINAWYDALSSVKLI